MRENKDRFYDLFDGEGKPIEKKDYRSRNARDWFKRPAYDIKVGRNNEEQTKNDK